MLVSESKTKEGYLYQTPLKDGTLEYLSDKKIETENIKEDLDNIFMILLSKPNGNGEIDYKGYRLKYKKEIKLWL